ncbi:MAG: hypothetical protein ACYC9R_10490 [Nitrosotalea sp.]
MDDMIQIHIQNSDPTIPDDLLTRYLSHYLPQSSMELVLACQVART